MTRAWIFVIVFALLLSNLPWFFTQPEMRQILGFPPWALYSFVMMIVFGVVTAYFLGRYWTYLAEDGSEEDDTDHSGSAG
jgi:hypothetical protein